MIPPQHIDLAIAGLDRIQDRKCFRCAFIRPMFLEDHYFTYPYFETLFSELERLGLVAGVHPHSGLGKPEWTSHGPFCEKIKNRLEDGWRFSGGLDSDGSVGPEIGFRSGMKLGHPISSILSPRIDSHLFVSSTLIGFGAMQRYPELKVMMAHGKASRMEEVIEKAEASTRTFPLIYLYPI